MSKEAAGRPAQPSGEPRQPRLTKRPGMALYRQVADDLTARIARSELAPGERLATEAQLADRYGVNRLTVRRALEEMTRAGLVRTEHGVGSFITTPMIRHRIDDGEASLSESMARRGLAVRHRVLEVTRLEPASGPTSFPEFPEFPGVTVAFRFVRYLEGEPWSIGRVLLPAALAPSHWDGARSLLAGVGAEHGLVLQRGETAFSATVAGPEAAGWLDVAAGSALLVVHGFNVDEAGRVVARFDHQIRGDRAEYVVNLRHAPE